MLPGPKPSETPSIPQELIEPVDAATSFGYTAEQLAAIKLSTASKLGTSILTHPVFRASLLQTTRATQDTLLNAYQAMLSLEKTGGPFKGLLAGMSRETLKTFIRGPIQVKTNDLAHILFPDNTTARALLLGASGGFVPAFFMQPWERYKTYTTAQVTKTTFPQYTRDIWNKQQGTFSAKSIGFMAQVYKAYFKTAAKETSMQAAIFIALPWATQLFAPYSKDHPEFAKIGASSLAGLFAGIVAAPLDVLKSLEQKSLEKKTTAREGLEKIYLKAYEIHMKSMIETLPYKSLSREKQLQIAKEVAKRLLAGVPLKSSLTVLSYSIAAYIMGPVLGLTNSHDKPPPASPPAPPSRVVMSDDKPADEPPSGSFLSAFDSFRSKPSSSRVDDGFPGEDVTTPEVDDLSAAFTRAMKI